MQLFADWWPFFLLIYLPRLVRAAGALWALAVRYRLDREIPDGLPMTAGEWLRARLVGTPLGDKVRVVVTSDASTEDSVDGYHPRHGIIQLRLQTYFKSDPVYWAVAAHELGHAVIRTAHPVVNAVFMAVGFAKWGCASLGLGLAVGNYLYGVPEITQLAYTLLCVAVVLDVFVLIDEALASGVADGLLRREKVLTRLHLRAARISLIAAFGSYVAGFVSHLMLLRLWPRLVELIGSGQFDGVAPPLSGWRFAAAVVVSAALVVHAATVIGWAVRPRYPDGDAGSRLSASLRWFEQICLVVFLVLVWDASADPDYWWCVLLAFIPALAALWTVLGLPFLLVYVWLALRIAGWQIRFGGVDESGTYRQARARGAREVAQGDKLLQELAARSGHQPPWPQRVLALGKILYLPAVVAYWLYI